MDISSLTSGSGAATAPGPSRFSELTSEQFVKILFTELSNQDPLKPNDSNALLQQVSSIRSIESDLALQNKLQSVVTQNQLSTAGALLGKYVTGLSESLDPVEGTVRSVSQTKDGPVLVLASGARIPFESVNQIRDPATTNNTQTNPTSDSTPTPTPTPTNQTPPVVPLAPQPAPKPEKDSSSATTQL